VPHQERARLAGDWLADDVDFPRFPRFPRTARRTVSPPQDPLDIARSAIQRLQPVTHNAATDCEESEECEESPDGVIIDGADPRPGWRLLNAARFTADDLVQGHDPGGYCSQHRRLLSYPEQKRGACSWCVPVDPEREPEYWASHWRRFTERR
jgi:hypothetical protein